MVDVMALRGGVAFFARSIAAGSYMKGFGGYSL
jgi:hypothetical protein